MDVDRPKYKDQALDAATHALDKGCDGSSILIALSAQTLCRRTLEPSNLDGWLVDQPKQADKRITKERNLGNGTWVHAAR